MQPENKKIAEHYKIDPKTMDNADIANRQSAYKAAKQDYWEGELGKSKKASADAVSPVGVAMQVPSAVMDTTKRIGKGVVNYAKRLAPVPKGGTSPQPKSRNPQIYTPWTVKGTQV